MKICYFYRYYYKIEICIKLLGNINAIAKNIFVHQSKNYQMDIIQQFDHC